MNKLSDFAALRENNKKMEENMTLLEKLVGTEGMKVDVTANLAPEIYIKLFVTIVGAVLVSAMAVQLLGNVLKN